MEHLANIRFRTAYAAYEERKYSDAFKWYSRDLDNPKAYASTFNNVAIYYDEGIAVKKNKNKATELLVKAYCKRPDYAFGSRRLAERYDSGIGTPKNIVYAYYLYNKAGEDKYLKRRDALRELMTMKELEKAQTDLTSEICK